MAEMVYRSFTPELEILRAADGGSDGRTVVGIAVPFGRPRRIHEGLVEQFARGSANHQLAAAQRVKFTRGHEMLGGTLIGCARELRDDAAGLWGAFRVSATPAGDETLELIRDGALDELSVGFRERRNRTLPGGIVERVKVDVFEVAAVSEGAYGRGATINGVRGAEGTDDGIEVEDVTEDGAEASRLAIARARLALVRSV